MDNNEIPQKIIEQMEKLNESQLMHLNHIIVERLKLISNAKALRELAKFNLGDTVSFDNYGETVRGRIIKINQKTVTLITLDNKHKWKVAPVFLRKEKTIIEEGECDDDDSDTDEGYLIFDEKNPEVTSTRIHNDKKVSRNAPCPCGSGKKYKLCCGKT